MISSFLKELRVRNGLSQEDLARILHVSFATVSRWEMGKNKPSRLALQNLDSYCKDNGIQSASEYLARSEVL